ncbi:MAG: class I SAM-dependent rRNA methyltransferase [Candidatus Helarchaeota archaeon]
MNFEIKGKVIVDKNIADAIRNESIYVIYEKHIREKDSIIKSGDIVSIYDYDKKELLGTGFYENVGNIGVRLMTFKDVQFDEINIYNKLKSAYLIRKRMGFEKTYRWINDTADNFSGLIADRYNDLVVLESSSMGIDKILEIIALKIKEINNNIKAIYVRNDIRNRKINGLKIWKGFIGDVEIQKTKTIINETGVLYYVDIENGNKTGFYLDQRLNRIESSNYVMSDYNILDCFAYTGGFGIRALLKGAQVTFIEHNDLHIKMLRENLRLNNITKNYNIIKGDFWDFIEKDQQTYDMIILDPPSLITTRNETKIGENKYFKINLLALKKLKKQGLFISSSCSYFLDTNRFQSIILRAAYDLNIKLMRLGRVRGASPCHLINPRHSGLEYLKCYFFIRIN